MSNLSTRLRSLFHFPGSYVSPDVSRALLECADAAERLEREVAALRNDLQRVECLYRELQHAGEVRYDRAEAALAENAALRAACEAALEILPKVGSAPFKTKVRSCEIADQVRAALAKRGAT
jgi:hypothetical protein